MLMGFETDKQLRAECALLLYALYRSREQSSSLNGIDTWSRCKDYIKGALLKSTTMPEFIENFCKKAKINSMRPMRLTTDGAVKIAADGTRVIMDGVHNYQMELQQKDELMRVFNTDTIVIINMVRERIQREKFSIETDDDIVKGEGTEND